MLPMKLIDSSALREVFSYETPIQRLTTELLVLHELLLLHEMLREISHFPAFSSNSFVGELSFL